MTAPTEVHELARHAYSVKTRFLTMYRHANAGHVGCSLSCAEILVLLRFAWMGTEDTFILSKGHAAAALYAVLAEAGILTEEQIATFYADGTSLPAHPPIGKFDSIPFATGSLGHGLSLAAGMALGARLNQRPRKFFCLTSDGELDEGSTWEAALFIHHHALEDIVWLIDRNSIQGIGRTEDVLALEPLDAKLRSFGFYVVAADGHDFTSLLAARDACLGDPEAHGRPKAVLCTTVKGHGISYMKDTVDCHYLPMSETQYRQALEEVRVELNDRLEAGPDAR